MLPASGVGVGWAAITAVCRLCGLGCEDATRLRSHVSAVHPKASRSLREARFFGCGLCGKGFGSLADVTLHVRSSHAVVPTASTTNILTSALFNTSSLPRPPQHSLTLGVVEHAPDATLHEDFHIGQVMQYLNSCLAQGLSPGNKSQMNVSSLNTIQTKDSVYTNSNMAMTYCNQMRATGPVSSPFLKSTTMTHATRESWRNNQCKIANSRSKPDTSRVEMNGTLSGNGKTPSPVLFDSILVTPKVNKQISLDEAESKNGSVTMNDDDGNEGIVTGLGVVHTEKDLHGSPQVAWTEALTPVRDRGQTADDSDIDSDLENNNQLSAADYEQNGWSISAMAIFDNSCTNKQVTQTESCVTESKERDKDVNAFVSNDNGLVKTNDKLAHRSMQNGMLRVCDDDDGETYKEAESEDVTNIKNTSDHMNTLDAEEQSRLIDHPDGNADKLIDQIDNQHTAGGAIEALRNGEQMSTENTMETRSPVILKIPKPKNIPQTDSANDKATSSISNHVKRIPKVRKQCNFPCCNGGMVKAKKLMKNYGSIQKKKLKRAFASSVKLKRCSVSLVRLPSPRKIHDVNAKVPVNGVKQVDNDIRSKNSVEFEEKRDIHSADSDKGNGHIKIKLKDIIAKVRHYKKTQRYKKRNPFLFYHKHKKHRHWKMKKIGTLCKDNIHVSPKCVTDTGRMDIAIKQPMTKECKVMLDKLHIEDTQDNPKNDESPKCTALDIESPKCIPLDIPYGFQFDDVFDCPCEDSTSDLDAYRSDLCSSNIQNNLHDDPSISAMMPYDSIEIRSIFKPRPKKKKTWYIICEDPHPEDTIRVPRYHSRSHLKGIDPDGDPLEPTPQLVISHIAGSYLPHLASDSFLDHDMILKPKQQEQCDEFCPLAEKQYMCFYCRHRYACIAHLEMHIKSHPRRRSPTQPMPHSLFGCCFCDIAFTNANLLRGHSRHTCGITVPKIASHISLLDMLNCTTRCVYQCSQCYESFPSLGVATGHLKHTCRALSGKHTTNESTQGDIITCFEGEGSSGKHLIRTYVYECAKCMLKFPNRKVLEGHVKHLCVYDWI